LILQHFKFANTLEVCYNAVQEKGKGPQEMKMPTKKGGKKFTPCLGCPTPRKCTAAGKCMKKAR